MDAALRQLFDAEVEIKAHAIALSSVEDSIQQAALSVRTTTPLALRHMPHARV
jgi:hypothetical protein